jgi:hypothetical protein
MKKAFVLFLGVALLCFMAVDANAAKNSNGKIALHDAGAHNTKVNTCGYILDACGTIDVASEAAPGARDDIYVLAVDVVGIAGVRFGICCDGPFFFYGFTDCSDFAVPSAGWPACGEGISSTWSGEQAGPFVTIGILDTYVYGSSQCLSICADPRVGYIEFCDGSEPLPQCVATYPDNPHWTEYLGRVGFNGSGCGYNPCSASPVEQKSWGAVKSLYR